ncbi:unnamed protein product [Acanthoscelides obtectus]|uniref:Major facilitator superfamily (MFS) profile domain-containing protein n=1 Tax=Acanthoscelides obtectus TaxID=200917 RepID=A0A9P0KIT0_ACAOB|nr:unnamed protein product [Acanthoscelides obtectus]CAK1665316.1 Synaptic vesicle glycoprotein 2B [Acanthoscelides obtectus]
MVAVVEVRKGTKSFEEAVTLAGSHLWGYLGDTKGRRKIVLFSLVSSAAVSYIGSIIAITWLFILLRFINGILIGGSSAIIYAFAGEFHDNYYRPKVVSYIATFVAIGNMYLPGMAWLILPQQWEYYISFLDINFRPWRLLMIVYATPSLISALLIYLLPESPKYLLVRGENEEVMRILQNIYRINTGKDRTQFPVGSLTSDESVEGLKHEKNECMLSSMWQQTAPLFRKGYLLKTAMVCYLHFAIFLSTSAIIMWYPQILNSMSDYGQVVPSNEVTMCTAILYDEADYKNDIPEVGVGSGIVRSITSQICIDTVNEEVFLVSLIIGFVYAVSYIFIGTFINTFGPRRLLIGLMTFTTISGVIAQHLSGHTYIQVALGVFLVAATGVGIVNAIVVELYPTQIRGMALAVSLCVGRFGAMTGSNIAGPLMLYLCDYMFYVFAASHLVVIIMVFLLPKKKPDVPKIDTVDVEKTVTNNNTDAECSQQK